METTWVLFLWGTSAFLQVAAAPNTHPSVLKINHSSSPCFLWLDFSSGRIGQTFFKSNNHEFWSSLLPENTNLTFWMKIAETEQLYLLEIKKMSKNMTHPLECTFWEKQLEDKLNYLKYIITSIKTYILFRKYLDPIVYTLMATVGLFGNATMFLIMVTNSEMRKGANLLLLNLVIGDMLNLATNLPLFYIRYQISVGEVVCYIFSTLRAMFVASSALSVAILSLQRYRASINWSVAESHECFYIPAVWITSLVIAIPYSFAIHYDKGKCFRCRDEQVSLMIASLEYFLYCMLLPVIVTVLLCLAAQNIKKSIPGNPYLHLQKNRSRSAKVLICLIAIFFISYCPHHTWRFIFYWLQLDIWNYHYRCIDKITYYLMFANPCLNPFAMFLMSNNFRKHINDSLAVCYSKLQCVSKAKT